MNKFLIHLGYAMVLVTAAFKTSNGNQTQPVREDTAYARVARERADKIVKTLSVESEQRALRVRDIIAEQYQSLKNIHEAKGEASARGSLDSLHALYISRLDAELTPGQVDKVKDGMTYGVLPITYKGYLAMLPELTDAQKQQILTYLTEARELAMDAGSSEKKHGWFGKYKGKINNYLSAAGYDMKKAGEDWEKRRKASAEK